MLRLKSLANCVFEWSPQCDPLNGRLMKHGVRLAAVTDFLGISVSKNRLIVLCLTNPLVLLNARHEHQNTVIGIIKISIIGNVSLAFTGDITVTTVTTVNTVNITGIIVAAVTARRLRPR